jgi:hypothetical protein
LLWRRRRPRRGRQRLRAGMTYSRVRRRAPAPRSRPRAPARADLAIDVGPAVISNDRGLRGIQVG